MDLIDRIKEISGRIPKLIDQIETEEATKNAFIMPLINALGYDVFNPSEVTPEFTADVGAKKGEKVDYAIKKDGKIVMLMECKWCKQKLEEGHTSQLYRYFSVTEARFGILTNGILYKFFSDIEEPNKMDSKPFFEFNMLSFEEQQLEELKKFTKDIFDLENILPAASELKYTNSIKRVLDNEMVDPSEDFIKFFVSKVYSGRMTQSVKDQFSGIVKQALAQFIREKINARLKSALESEKEEEIEKELELDDSSDADIDLVVSEEETQGLNIIKAISAEVISPERVFLRNGKRYCAILLDDSNRKTICRLHFKTSNSYIGIFRDKKEEKVKIENLSEMYTQAGVIKSTISSYISPDDVENSNSSSSV